MADGLLFLNCTDPSRFVCQVSCLLLLFFPPLLLHGKVWTDLDFPQESDFYAPLLKMQADVLSAIAVDYVHDLLQLTRGKVRTAAQSIRVSVSVCLCVCACGSSFRKPRNACP